MGQERILNSIIRKVYMTFRYKINDTMSLPVGVRLILSGVGGCALLKGLLRGVVKSRISRTTGFSLALFSLIIWSIKIHTSWDCRNLPISKDMKTK